MCSKKLTNVQNGESYEDGNSVKDKIVMTKVIIVFCIKMFHLLLVLGESVSLLGINNAESESSSGGGLDTVNISLEIII